MDSALLHRMAADAMQSYGLLPAFPPDATREAQARRVAGPERNGDIRDLRQLPWFSIDNDDTRDLDQLTYAEPLAAGAARLQVAVADVDAMVRPGGAIDTHAEAPGHTGLSGHFGLAVNDYAHSTAPNRRFPDLVTQRLLKVTVAGDAPPYSLEALTQIARHCTLQEDNANKVERKVLKVAAAFLLQHRIGDLFDGLVTGTPAKGTFARITSPLVEGRIVRGFKRLEVGDAVRLRLVAVDPAQGFIDFERC
jgi:exoribonuclease R